MSTSLLRILVYPHSMELGGSQLNAIELAGAMRDLGHEIVVLGDNGPLVDLVDQLGLERLSLDPDRRRPSLSNVKYLRALVAERRFDVVHGYEWPPGLEAAAAAFANASVVAVCTVMSMAVAPFLPKRLPLVVGTRSLQGVAAKRQLSPVFLIEPPVNVRQNAPGHSTEEFLSQHGLVDENSAAPPGPIVNIVVVSRLASELKLEGVLTAIKVVSDLAQNRPVRLVIVGDGNARSTVEEQATRANIRAGWRAVVLTGQLLDPRPAYAAADVVLGMGGSALRALAFAKPLVVQGEEGFWELLTPESCPRFLTQGWYGVGSTGDGEERLHRIMQPLLADAALRDALGAYGRRLVTEFFNLERAARNQEEIYRIVLDSGCNAHFIAGASDFARSAAGVSAYKIKRRYQRLRGKSVSEDFNAVGLAKMALGDDVGQERRQCQH